MATDALIILIVAYAAVVGTRRGFVLVSLELVSFIAAAAIALAVYHPIGSWLVGWAGISLGLADIAAFMAVWIVVELALALAVRFWVVPRLSRSVQFSAPNQIGGAVANSLRTLMLLTLGLIIFTGLPLAAAAKEPITSSRLARGMLGFSSGLQALVDHTLGQDITSSLTVFTVTNDPESTKRIELGFKTTAVSPDTADEEADLVLVNHERTLRGLAPLKPNPQAQVVARAYARRIFADGVFSHIDNSGHNPFDRMKAGGVTFGAAGENLALSPTLQLAHDGLMHSPGHKANILGESFKRVGIGVIDGGQYGIMVVQDFTD